MFTVGIKKTLHFIVRKLKRYGRNYGHFNHKTRSSTVDNTVQNRFTIWNCLTMLNYFAIQRYSMIRKCLMRGNSGLYMRNRDVFASTTQVSTVNMWQHVTNMQGMEIYNSCLPSNLFSPFTRLLSPSRDWQRSGVPKSHPYMIVEALEYLVNFHIRARQSHLFSKDYCDGRRLNSLPIKERRHCL